MRWTPMVLCLALGTLPAVANGQGGDEWALADWRSDPGRAEEFLRSATVIDSRRIPIGVTRPLRLTLEAGGVRADGSFKSVDIYEQKMKFEDGSFALNFRDTYKNEIAAYQLDRMLGLGLVPPTIERQVDGENGALRVWIEGATTEAERLKQGLSAPDPEAWNEQVATLRLFFSLTANSDFNNVNNILIDSNFLICAIDHSRAFQTSKKLVGQTVLMRFSRPLLAQLEALDQEALSTDVGAWLSKSQIKALLKRRDLILRRVDKLVELKGEAVVLFD